jgi:diphthamide biosynthesis enzyme Dph1/Dph2-like protein
MADSNYGNVGADDISARHVGDLDSTVIVRFGQVDLSTSGSIPVILVPDTMPLVDPPQIADRFVQYCSQQLWLSSEQPFPPLMLVYDLCHAQDVHILAQLLRERWNGAECASLPPSADLHGWSFEQRVAQRRTSDSDVSIGGLVLQSPLQQEHIVWYIGDNESQLVSIQFQYPAHRTVVFSPATGTFAIRSGQDTRGYKQRAFGIQVHVRLLLVGLYASEFYWYAVFVKFVHVFSQDSERRMPASSGWCWEAWGSTPSSHVRR